MSGFDNSQPITDEAVLEDAGVGTAAEKRASETAAADPPADPDELGDATPGPR
jgi:hypothetical protein